MCSQPPSPLRTASFGSSRPHSRRAEATTCQRFLGTRHGHRTSDTLSAQYSGSLQALSTFERRQWTRTRPIGLGRECEGKLGCAPTHRDRRIWCAAGDRHVPTLNMQGWRRKHEVHVHAAWGSSAVVYCRGLFERGHKRVLGQPERGRHLPRVARRGCHVLLCAGRRHAGPGGVLQF